MVVHILDVKPGAALGHKGFIRWSAEWAHYSQVATAPVSYAPHSQPAQIKTLCCTTSWRLSPRCGIHQLWWGLDLAVSELRWAGGSEP